MTRLSKQRKRQSASLTLAVLLAVSLTTACAGSPVTNTAPIENNGNPGNSDSNNLIDPDTAQPEPDEEQTEEPTEVPQDVAEYTAEGVYNGQIDGHSIELDTNLGPAAFQFEPELGNTISTLEKNDKVKYTYVEKEYEADGQTFKQLRIIGIEKLD